MDNSNLKEIIDGVANSLNMTVDSLVKAYPHLRTEYSWYHALRSIECSAMMLMLLIGIILCFCGFVMQKKTVKTGIVLFTTLAAILLIVNIVKGFVCPDVLIIERIINGVNN